MINIISKILTNAAALSIINLATIIQTPYFAERNEK